MSNIDDRCDTVAYQIGILIRDRRIPAAKQMLESFERELAAKCGIVTVDDLALHSVSDLVGGASQHGVNWIFALEHAGIETAADLIDLKEADLISIRGVSVGAIESIRAGFKRVGHRWPR